MMNKLSRAKQDQINLFQVLSRHYENYTHGIKKEIFLCPLCLKEFEIMAIENDLLSLAHIIPKFLGGRKVTLSCRECNSTIGSQVEGPESRRIKMWKAFYEKDKASIGVHLSTGKSNNYIPARASFKSHEKGSDLTLNISKSKNELIDDFLEKILRGEASIDMSFKSPNPRISYLTYLHAAYMFLFQQFGYDWILNRSSESIRRQLRNPNEEVICFYPINFPKYKNNIIVCSSSENPISFYRVVDSMQSKGFLVVFNCISLICRDLFGVWIPDVGQEYKKPKEPSFNVQVLPVFQSHRHLENSEFNYAKLCSIL